MKQLIFSLLIIAVAFTSSAQSYTPFPESDAIWSINTDKFSVLGDTIINDVSYKKYFRTSEDSVFVFENSSYYAAVREDSSKRVWGIRYDSDTEYLLYDFSKEIGDTLYVSPFENLNGFAFDSTGLIVIDIDSVLINESYRKRFTFTTLFWYHNDWFTYESWIEGIGSTYGLFSPGTFYPGTCKATKDIWYYTLLCYQEPDFIEYFGQYNPEEPTCFHPVPSAIQDETYEKLKPELFPNPVIGKSSLLLEGYSGQTLSVGFYNLNGQLVKTEMMSQGKLQIDNDDFPKGMYFYKIEREGTFLTSGKFVVE